MRPTLSSPLLFRLSEFVGEQTGLHFPEARWGDLERGMLAATPEFNFADVESCSNWLLSAPLTRDMHEILASHLSIGETYFFREPRSLEILEKQILPPLLQARRENGRFLRIWSAGCSTGEEAYTIAIMLDRLIPDLRNWNITILATDFNPKFLRKAALGVYGEWSFRDAPDWLRERYFTKGKKGLFEINQHIRKMVTFSYLNFAEDVYPSLPGNTGAMDVILCRNVLMYFTAQRARQVTDNFYRALVDSGWLIVSPTEASNKLLSRFTPCEFPGAVLYRKTGNAKSLPSTGRLPVSPLPETNETAFAMEPEVATAMLSVSPDVPPFAVAQAELEPPPLVDGGEALSGMARSYADQGKLDEALEWCKKATSADNMNPAYHYLSATILQELGQHEIAIQALMRALYLDPDFALAHFALGNLNQSQGRYREAQRYFGNVLLLLRNRPPDEILPEADGLTAGRLTEIVASLLKILPQVAVANI
ncbi:MAG: CheR family methyltransferase [Nitrosomonadales bacterium]